VGRVRCSLGLHLLQAASAYFIRPSGCSKSRSLIGFASRAPGWGGFQSGFSPVSHSLPSSHSRIPQGLPMNETHPIGGVPAHAAMPEDPAHTPKLVCLSIHTCSHCVSTCARRCPPALHTDACQPPARANCQHRSTASQEAGRQTARQHRSTASQKAGRQTDRQAESRPLKPPACVRACVRVRLSGASTSCSSARRPRSPTAQRSAAAAAAQVGRGGSDLRRTPCRRSPRQAKSGGPRRAGAQRAATARAASGATTRSSSTRTRSSRTCSRAARRRGRRRDRQTGRCPPRPAARRGAARPSIRPASACPSVCLSVCLSVCTQVCTLPLESASISLSANPSAHPLASRSAPVPPSAQSVCLSLCAQGALLSWQDSTDVGCAQWGRSVCSLCQPAPLCFSGHWPSNRGSECHLFACHVLGEIRGLNALSSHAMF
jgi:hypothetical protein